MKLWVYQWIFVPLLLIFGLVNERMRLWKQTAAVTRCSFMLRWAKISSWGTNRYYESIRADASSSRSSHIVPLTLRSLRSFRTTSPLRMTCMSTGVELMCIVVYYNHCANMCTNTLQLCSSCLISSYCLNNETNRPFYCKRFPVWGM